MKSDPLPEYSEEQTHLVLGQYRLWLAPRLYFPRVISFKESPEHADWDYDVMVVGRLDHRIEVKNRGVPSNEYEKTKVPIRKHSTAEHFYKKDGLKTFYVCRFTDWIGVLPLWEEPDEEGIMVARYDRGPATDYFAFYDVARFIKI